jgi:hypothetical protein
VYDYQAVTGSIVGSGSQGEWILERTEACGVSCNFPSINNFGTESITSAQAATGQSWSDPANPVQYPYAQTLAPTAYNMYNCAYKQELARTNPFTNSSTFSITWLNYGVTDHC